MRNSSRSWKILHIEEKQGTRDLVKRTLAQARGTDGQAAFTLQATANPKDGLRVLESSQPNLVIMDTCQESFDGRVLLQEARQRSQVPVVILTGHPDPQEETWNLLNGADRVIRFPFNHSLFVPNILASLRGWRSSQGYVGKLCIGSLTIDLDKKTVTKGGEELHLSWTLWSLLEHLATHPNQVLAHSEILMSIWGPHYRKETGLLNVYVLRLRRLIEPNPKNPTLLTTNPGQGYMFRTETRVQERDERDQILGKRS